MFVTVLCSSSEVTLKFSCSKAARFLIWLLTHPVPPLLNSVISFVCVHFEPLAMLSEAIALACASMDSFRRARTFEVTSLVVEIRMNDLLKALMVGSDDLPLTSNKVDFQFTTGSYLLLALRWTTCSPSYLHVSGNVRIMENINCVLSYILLGFL